MLSYVDWENNCNNVQDTWNDFENKLVNIVDSLVPISDFKGNNLALKPCPTIKRKLNETVSVIKGLIYNFTIVKMTGP